MNVNIIHLIFNTNLFEVKMSFMKLFGFYLASLTNSEDKYKFTRSKIEECLKSNSNETILILLVETAIEKMLPKMVPNPTKNS